MEIYQLRAFATAARLGNLTRTAEALHLTQPAITAQIKALEEELGVALFERRPGGITLTRAGELLLQDAEQILTTAGHLLGRARELQGEVTGQLVLGTLGDPESLRLGTLLGVLSDKLPLLDIKTRQGAAEDVREQVAAGLLRGGFYIGLQPPAEVGGLLLQTVHYRIVAPWRDRERVLHAGWRELAAMPWVGTSPRQHVQVLLNSLFARQGLAPHQTIESDEVALPFSLARAGVGLALVREELALQGSERQEVVIWPHARVSAQLAFIYPHAAEHDPALVATLSALRGVWGLAAR